MPYVNVLYWKIKLKVLWKDGDTTISNVIIQHKLEERSTDIEIIGSFFQAMLVIQFNRSTKNSRTIRKGIDILKLLI